MTKSISAWPFFCFLAAVWAPMVVTVSAHHDFFNFPIAMTLIWLLVGGLLVCAAQPLFQRLPRATQLAPWALYWFLLLNHFVLKASFLSSVPHLKKVVAVISILLAIIFVLRPRGEKFKSNLGLINFFLAAGVVAQLSQGHLWMSSSSRQVQGRTAGESVQTVMILMDMFSFQQSRDGAETVLSAARELAQKHRLTLYTNHHAGYRVTVQSVPEIIANENESWDANGNLLPDEVSIFHRARENGLAVNIFAQRPVYCRFYSSVADRCFSGRGEENLLSSRWSREFAKSAKLYLATLHPNLHALFSRKLSKDELLRLPESPLEQIERFVGFISDSPVVQPTLNYMHTLFPHSPFVTRADCTLDTSRQGKDFLLYFEDEQRQRFLEQSLCALKKLDEILSVLPENTRVLIISDHGREGRVKNNDSPSHENIRNASHVYAWSRKGVESKYAEVSDLTSNTKLSEFLFSGAERLPRESSVTHTWFVRGKSQTLERLKYQSTDGVVWNLK